jgi:signal transduction histidine kinase
MVVVAAGLSAFGLAQVEEPHAGRRAVRLFALGHLLVGVLILMQWSLFWREVFSPLVAFALLAVGGLLLAGSCLVAVDAGDLSDLRRLRSRYDAQIREAARVEERSRLARDLHDAVKQQLFVIQTAAATTEVRLDRDPAGVRDAVAHIRTAAREATREMEALIDELQAVPLENVGLVEALKRQCEGCASAPVPPWTSTSGRYRRAMACCRARMMRSTASRRKPWRTSPVTRARSTCR